MRDWLLKAIETVYDCVGDEFDHQRALAAYSRAADDTGLFLAEIRPVLGGFGNYHYVNIPDEAVEAMVTKHDSAATSSLFQNIALLPDRTPVLRRVFVPDDVHFKTEMYRNTSEPWGFHSDGASILDRGPTTTLVCGFLRHPHQSEADEELLATMAVLNNHYCRAMTLQHRLDKLEQAVIQSSNVLDLIQFGLVLYGKRANPVFVNAAAQRMIDARDGLELTAKGLRILDRVAAQQFRGMVSVLYRNDLPADARTGGIVSVSRMYQRKPYSLMIVPLRLQREETDMNAVTAAVFLFDPEAPRTTAIDMFVSSYGLTQSEAELAHRLALGETLDSVAERRGVTRNTVKTQLQSIFSKTETNRQSELVSLLMRSVAGINLRTLEGEFEEDTS